jgi:hypothetical protein
MSETFDKLLENPLELPELLSTKDRIREIAERKTKEARKVARAFEDLAKRASETIRDLFQ